MSDIDKVTLEDTDRIQKAIEDVVDQETAAIPILAVTEAEAEVHDNDMADEEEDVDDIDDAPDLPHADTELHSWFFTFMCMNIPIVGWIYLLYLAFNKKKTDRRYFARAYLFYKLLFLLISGVILAILLYFGLQLLDQILAYMEML
ncbi:MAG: hypothetical protein ACRDBO_11205 [Lachnospiraceae bacterium]